MLILNYWRDGKLCLRPFLFLLMADSVEVISVSTALSLVFLTYREIGKAKNISETARTFHLRILIAATAQTLTPILLVYIPYFLNVTISLFHLYSPFYSALSMLLLSFFPCIDPILIILLIKPYRQGFMRLLGKRNRKIAVVASAFTAT
ncbi:hypothetical protein PMAYCL1PPCAC_03464, partial [Pristionchus mayeri]